MPTRHIKSLILITGRDKLGAWKIGVIIANTLILTACGAMGPKINWNDPQSITEMIRVERDDYKKITYITGPNLITDSGHYSGDSLLIFAAKPDVGGNIGYQIYIMDHYYGNWRFYDSAYDSNGNRLETITVSRETVKCGSTGCIHDETLSIIVTRAYLENNQSSGIRFKVSGKGGEEEYSIHSAYIKAFLSVAK